jgi:hypothetical protein
MCARVWPSKYSKWLLMRIHLLSNSTHYHFHIERNDGRYLKVMMDAFVSRVCHVLLSAGSTEITK